MGPQTIFGGFKAQTPDEQLSELFGFFGLTVLYVRYKYYRKLLEDTSHHYCIRLM